MALLPEEIRAQVRQAVSILERHLGVGLEAIYLFGSAIDGGLKPYSDIDLLVSVTEPPSASVREALMQQLLSASAPPNTDAKLRPLEVTVIAKEQVTPWQYPVRRELQFGEWLRTELEAGEYEAPTLDHDLAILLRKVRQHSLCLIGLDAEDVLPAIPDADFQRALHDTLEQWHAEDDIRGDEWHIVLALTRIWFSAETGKIAPKDVAAKWALEKSPMKHKPIIEAALATYYGASIDGWENRIPEILALVLFIKATLTLSSEKRLNSIV